MYLENKKPKSPAGILMMKGIKNKNKPEPPKQIRCYDCGSRINAPEEIYSLKHHGRRLCRKCQKN